MMESTYRNFDKGVLTALNVTMYGGQTLRHARQTLRLAALLSVAVLGVTLSGCSLQESAQSGSDSLSSGLPAGISGAASAITGSATAPVIAAPQAGAIGADAVEAGSDEAQNFLVADQAAFNQAVQNAGPGDVITLANGTWHDFEIIFTGQGAEDAPLTLTAQDKGQVIISGQSNLKLAGEYLVVSGLVFKDGFTPTGEVISYRLDADNLAYHSRVTETVIDGFNQPERYEVDFWVMMYGKHNRFDHNFIAGKANKGVTMAVRLNTEDSRENYHRIDHNYFGPRQILGSNGGETLRIGTSHYSLSDSFTVVENNYFDRANGELEIISNKSGKNEFRNNTFFASRGTLTMRHGNDNVIEGNVFFGDNADHTGGIRVINGGQKVVHNYMEGVKGTRFGGALVVMNGVPDSPINRYHQVENAVIENNTLINSDNIQLAAGSDAERSAVPINSTFSGNLIYHEDGRDTFTVYDDVSGIAFSKNVLNGAPSPELNSGFDVADITISRAENGLIYPSGLNDVDQGDVDLESVGIARDLKVTSKAMTGPSWYPKTEPVVPFGSGNTVSVSSEPGALYAAINAAGAGDVLTLAAGDYTVSKFLRLTKPVTIKGNGDVTIAYERTALFELYPGASLQLDGVNITGARAPDNAGNAVIRTGPSAMLPNYRLEILNSHFADLDINHSFDVVRVAKGTFADNMLIKNSRFENVTGSILKLNAETDDYGIYNSEYVTIEDSQFKDVGQALINFYRGGTDESTFGPHFLMTGSTLENVGNDRRNKSKAVFELHGVQVTDVYNNSIKGSPYILLNHTVGEPKSRIVENTFIDMPGVRVNELNSQFENTAIIKDNVVRTK